MGVKPIYKHFKHDGVNGPNMATVYSDRGFGVRGPVVFYNRANEAAARLKPGDFDWKADLRGWRALGSLRRNFCGSLPHDRGTGCGDDARGEGCRCRYVVRSEFPGEALEDPRRRNDDAVETIGRIVENVDVLVGNEEDLQKGLGIPGPEVAAKSKLDPSVFFGMMDKVTKKLPHVKIVATTLREVHSTSRHSWSAVAWVNGKTYSAPTAELDVLDRVGGGDGFASGFHLRAA